MASERMEKLRELGRVNRYYRRLSDFDQEILLFMELP